MLIFDNLKNDIKNIFESKKPKEVSSVMIYGSYARGDHILGWSDMDVMIFIDSECIDYETFKQLGKINEELSKKYENIPITFRIHSIDEFPNYTQFEGSLCSYSLFSYYLDGIFLYGRNLKNEMYKILKYTTITRVINDLRNKLISSRHESRSLVTSSNEFQPFTQTFHINVKIKDFKLYKLAKYIDMILECALCCNILKGSFATKKNDISKIFNERFSNFEYSELPLKCIKIRENWSKIDKISYNSIINECSDFFENIITLFDEKSRYNQINNAFNGILINDTKFKYRKNVCAIIINEHKELLLVKKDKDSEWCFVQGGLENNESYEEALKRELKEEINLVEYEILAIGKYKNEYDWPDDLQINKGFKGQSQTFFLIRLKNKYEINLNKEELYEFKWVNLKEVYKYIEREDIVESYENLSKEFSHVLKSRTSP